MRIFLSMIIAVGIQFVSSNFFASIGQPLKGLILSFTRQIMFIIPLMLILPLFMGVDGIIFAGPISDLLACFPSFYSHIGIVDKCRWPCYIEPEVINSL